MLEIKRLHFARLEVVGEQWPVHGFVVTHPGAALLVDTGVGGPDEMLSDWRVGDPTAPEAIADINTRPAPMNIAINNPPHFRHSRAKPGFSQAACYIPPAEV